MVKNRMQLALNNIRRRHVQLCPLLRDRLRVNKRANTALTRSANVPSSARRRLNNWTIHVSKLSRNERQHVHTVVVGRGNLNNAAISTRALLSDLRHAKCDKTGHRQRGTHQLNGELPCRRHVPRYRTKLNEHASVLTRQVCHLTQKGGLASSNVNNRNLAIVHQISAIFRTA